MDRQAIIDELKRWARLRREADMAISPGELLRMIDTLEEKYE